MELRMSGAERALFLAFVAPCRSYLEFGAGGSTLAAFQAMQGDIVSVDSARTWLEDVEAASGHSSRVKLFHVDIGPVGDWGFPTGETRRDNFPAYSQSIWPVVDLAALDLILVDGRFRVACFAEAVARVRSDTPIAVHDYRSRAHFHVVETVARPIAEAEDLTVFLPLPGRGDAARALADAYRLDPH